MNQKEETQLIMVIAQIIIVYHVQPFDGKHVQNKFKQKWTTAVN